MNTHHKVIGYFAYKSGTVNVICDGESCLIAASEGKMADYISTLSESNPKSCTIRKTRFGEIFEGMKRGGAYAFDKESYGRFAEVLAKQGGIVSEIKLDMVPPSDKAIELIHIKWIDLQFKSEPCRQ